MLESLRTRGPLGTVRRAANVLCDRPGAHGIGAAADRLLGRLQRRLDRRFDRRYGVDTSGVVPLSALTIVEGNVEEGIWYEPMSVGIFHQIMAHLAPDFGAYELVDFGSGKGRVLLIASRYGFRRVIGVEFAEELHRIATDNAARWARSFPGASPIRTVHADATTFPLPDVPLVLFFFSPFGGRVLERVLENVMASLARRPRDMILVFHGRNAGSLLLFRAMGLDERELRLRPDWLRLEQYRTFVFTARATLPSRSGHRVGGGIGS